MSDYRAIAAVTATLRHVLDAAVRQVLDEAPVRVRRPGAAQSESEVRVFLYQVERNPYLRNAELPVRDDRGELIEKPQVSLNLHYLVTFYGEEKRLVPELLMGACVTYLHTHPTPTAEQIRRAIEESGKNPDLEGCGLPEQADLLRFVPTRLETEDMQRLWTVFFQQPYVLSVAYRCSVVLLQPDVLPRAMLPVRRASPKTGSQVPEIGKVRRS